MKLTSAVEKLLDGLDHWGEPGVIYQYRKSGEFDCDPKSTFETVSREHKTHRIFTCNSRDDLIDWFPGIGINPTQDVGEIVRYIIEEVL